MDIKDIKEVLSVFLTSNKDLKTCIPNYINDSSIQELVEKVCERYPLQVEKYKKGKAITIKLMLELFLKS